MLCVWFRKQGYQVFLILLVQRSSQAAHQHGSTAAGAADTSSIDTRIGRASDHHSLGAGCSCRKSSS